MTERVAILGLGLMGGSLAMALRRRAPDIRITGYARRLETREEALRLGLVDGAADDPAQAVADATLVVCGVPVLAVPDLLASCRAALPAGCLVTDVGSTKAWLVRETDSLLAGGRAIFVGSHPIAGSDETGLSAAREELYQDAVVVVTPGAGTPPDAVGRIAAFWGLVGARCRVMTPDQHDQLVARTSHLPHVVAAALAQAVLTDGPAGCEALCGTGFRDTTRVAGGSEDLWHDILKTNRQAVQAVLADFSGRLDEFRRLLERGDFEGIRAYLGRSRTVRRNWEPGR
ncbi:MAG: hypothetical protein A2498_01380 [Lentisphaerae bacterium RIFOXYC12_FULL_60_16]|nr:MAG: hypothetical protein A2498_01380 [Lentisphaerae bacterium RIFOXYC12_FULL_60_16]